MCFLHLTIWKKFFLLHADSNYIKKYWWAAYISIVNTTKKYILAV